MAQHAGNTLENNRRERGEAHAGMGGGKRLVRRVLALLALAAVLLAMALPAGCGGNGGRADGGAVREEGEASPDEKMEAYIKKMIGTGMPDAVMTDLDGRETALSSFLGKPVVLEFAKTTCPYCQAVQPVVEEAAVRRPDAVFVQAFPSNTPEEIRAYLAENGSGAPAGIVLAGPADGVRELFGNYPYVPVFLFIDAGGTIADVQFGVLDLDTMEQSLDLAMASGVGRD